MSKYCPIVNRNVIYLDCMECEDKECEKEKPDSNTTKKAKLEGIKYEKFSYSNK